MLVKIKVGPDEEIELPLVQAEAIGRSLREFEKPCWHRNECGCCFSIHESPEPGATLTGGYVVGPDGERDWIETTWHVGEED
jgi:hypothetical protein